MNAAMWSALAASFAALSAFISMLIHRRTLLESVRPELVLTGWSRRSEGDGDSAHEVLAFRTLRNVGRGPALHVWFECFLNSDNRPVYAMATKRLPILAAGDEADIDGEIIVWWKNVASGDNGFRSIPIVVKTFCIDSRSRRHETRYSLFAVELSPGVGIADELMPGVGLVTRTTVIRSTQALRLRYRVARVPLLGRPFRDRH
jgi:hypothetical protein